MFTFTNFLLAVTASLSVFTSSVDAASIARRDVIVPPILYPTTGTVWFVGETHNVTWDTSVVPPGFTGTGLIVLGFLEGDSINEHLDLDHPLAQGFPITAGRTNVVVPSVPEKDSYILVLFGDSGNASGKFSIRVGISSNSSTSTTAPASTSSTTATATASSASVTATPSGTTSSSASGANLPVSTTDTDSAHPTLGGSAFSTPEASGASSTASSTNTIVPPPVDTTTSPSGTASRSQSTVVATVGTSNTSSGTAGAAQAPASTQGSGAATLRGINSISLMGFCAILGAWAVL